MKVVFLHIFHIFLCIPLYICYFHILLHIFHIFLLIFYIYLHIPSYFPHISTDFGRVIRTPSPSQASLLSRAHHLHILRVFLNSSFDFEGGWGSNTCISDLAPGLTFKGWGLHKDMKHVETISCKPRLMSKKTFTSHWWICNVRR